MNKKETKEKIIRYCSRCGKEWCVLGRILEYGKHYPAFTVKLKNGTEKEYPPNDEIKKALCRECAKEWFDEQAKEEASTIATRNMAGQIEMIKKVQREEMRKALSEKIKEIEKTTTRGMVYDGVRSKEIIEILKERR